MSISGRVEWINPFTIHDEDTTGKEIYEGDLNAIRRSDAVLLHRPGDYEVCGAYIEAGVAGENDIPTVVWNSADTACPEFLRWHSDHITGSPDEAVLAVEQLLNV